MNRSFFKVVAINIAVLLICAVVIELIFGSWVTGRNYGLLVVPRNVNQQFDTAGLYGGGIAVFKRDENGLRGTYDDPAKIDILTVGGSTTNEILVGEGETWSDRLGQAFTEAGHPMTVVNAGVDGQTTVGHIKNFEAWFPMIPNLKARYVLALIGINDLARVQQDNHDPKSDRMYEPYKQARQYLRNNSAIYGLFRTLKGMLAAKDAKLVHSGNGYKGLDWAPYTGDPGVEPFDTAYDAGLDAYQDRIKDLAQTIRAFGAEPIFVTQGRPGYRVVEGVLQGRVQSDGRIDIGEYAGLTAVNRRAMETCRAVGAICIDLGTELHFGEGDHYDRLHTTPQGSAKIGRYLFEKLKDKVN